MVPRPAIFAGFASVGIAIGIAAIALVSAWGAFLALPAADSIDRMRKGLEVDQPTASAAARASLRAGRIFGKGQYFSDAALAAGRLPAAERERALDGMTLLAVVDEALTVEPTSPFNWARRSQLLLESGDLRGARQSLETSLLMGRFVPGLTMVRLRIMLALLRKAPDPSLERHFDDQIRIAARTEPHALAAFADGGAAEGRTQRLLSTEYRLYDAYLKALMGKRARDRAAR